MAKHLDSRTLEIDHNQTDTVPHSPKRITTANFVADLAVIPDKSAVFASIGNHLSKLEKINQVWQETYLLEDKSDTEYIAIEALSAGNYAVWMANESRDLYQVTKEQASIDNKTAEGYSITRFAKKDTPLGSEHVLPFIYADTLMIGTENGVYTYQNGASEAFTQVKMLPPSLRTKNKDVFKTLEDKEGRLWYHAGRDTGVVYPDEVGNLVSQEKIFKPYNNSGTRGLAYFNQAIWFGVTNGSIYRMSEDVIKAIPISIQVSIRSLTNIDTGKLFSIALDASSIPVESNSIRIGYALPDYSATKETLYRTKMSGQGHVKWTLWSNESNKDFPFLAGGDYTFFVEAKDQWGRISTTQHNFSVDYPWYLSSIAWLCYGILVVILFIVSIKIGQRRQNTLLVKQNLALENKVAERTLDINQKVDELKQLQILKDRFFANVSHEFRTPLTLTIGPLQEMIKKHQKSMGKASHHLTLTALSNAQKMLALVGQVLDVNRLELGTLPLRISEYDIAQLVRTNAERFKPWAEQQDQTISCINCENPKLLFCDQDQLDKCLSNLLSNAIKYSGSNTQITLEIICLDNKVGIKVSDNGEGIPEKIKDKVFERFYQAESAHNTHKQGSGIGLNLVKEIAILHHGDVELVTKVNEGCQFTLWLLEGSDHFTNEQLIEPIYLPDSSYQPTLTTYNIDLDKATVLVVDDNPSLRQFISQCLSTNYQILEAENGEQGIAFALKYLPDIIISDVTMPGLSGLEMTNKLKENPETGSIPILLLSAQTSKRDIVAGFSSGANDYLTKPFDTSELVMRINALLETYKDKPSAVLELSDKLGQQTKNGDSFEGNLNKHILENISNSQFSIEELAKLLFMSKETLRRKSNQAMNMSPASYIHMVRIQQSKLLIEKQQLNISEVAYAVGFDSLAYFSKSFKKHYGVSPSSL